MNIEKIRGIWEINNTKIKYLKILDKLYKVTDLSFFYMSVEAKETDLLPATVPEDEVWDYEFFKGYKVKLINKSGGAEIVDFEEWKSRKGDMSR